MLRRALIACALATHVPLLSAQLLPPPGDGDIRQVYFEIQNRSEIWLTLKPKSPKGGPAPMLTFTFSSPGKGTAASPKQIEVRAYAPMWTPRSDLVFVLDDQQKIDLHGTGVNGMPSDYSVGNTTIAVLRQMAAASRISVNALGFDFELTEAHRKAIATFLDRLMNAH